MTQESESKYKFKDNPTESGIALCDTDVLNDCLMNLKYTKVGFKKLGTIEIRLPEGVTLS